MANWTYLDAYLSSLPQSQRTDLLNLVYGNVLSGQITTLAEYQANLDAELAQLSTSLPAPIFHQYIEPYQGITHSANINAMESQAITALGTLYTEAVLLEDSISNYNKVIAGSLDSIGATLANLEKQMDVLEELSLNLDGYVTGVYDTFNEANTYRLMRSASLSTSPFIISDIGYIPASYDAQVLNNSVQLPSGGSTTFKVMSAYLENIIPASGTSSGVALSGANPYDVTNLEIGTAPWVETVDIPTLSASRCEMDLVLEIAGVQQINTIVIDPFTRFPYRITGIDYTENIASSGTGGGPLYYPLDPSLFPVVVSSKVSLQFQDIFADSLRLHIVQDHYSALRYIEDPTTSSITSIFDVAANQFVPGSGLTDPSSYYFAMDSNMQNLINGGIVPPATTVDVYEFMVGAKTIDVQENTFIQLGLFVTKPYAIAKAGAIGLNTNENTPPYTSIEYDIQGEYYDLDATGVEQFTSAFKANILPAEISTIRYERLDGTDHIAVHNWTADTRFPVQGSVAVYQNGIFLNSSQYSTSLTPGGDGRVRITIDDFVISPSIRNTSFFTVNYTPTAAAYTVPLSKHDQVNVMLRMLLRSASPNSRITPIVDSYSMKFKTYN